MQMPRIVSREAVQIERTTRLAAGCNDAVSTREKLSRVFESDTAICSVTRAWIILISPAQPNFRRCVKV